MTRAKRILLVDDDELLRETLIDAVAEAAKRWTGAFDAVGEHTEIEERLMFGFFAPGDYIVTGGPLRVTGNGGLNGEYVGFYLSGADAKLELDFDSNIALSAPKSGVLAGLLFFSSPRDSAQGRKEIASGLMMPTHYIRSDNARRLVGTIYLPSGKLLIDGRDPIADRSEYTVVIADTFELQDGPNLVLRTDYHLSDIPVPQGVGPVSDPKPRLVE